METNAQRVPNMAVWFELPAMEFNRAVKFYQDVFEVDLTRQDMDNMTMALFPYDQTSVSGALVMAEGYKPNSEGGIVYLNGGDDLSRPLQRVTGAGGEVIMEKTRLSDEIGCIALFKDSEGNRVGLWSPN